MLPRFWNTWQTLIATPRDSATETCMPARSAENSTHLKQTLHSKQQQLHSNQSDVLAAVQICKLCLQMRIIPRNTSELI
jgi:hypothetical protein